MFKEHRSEILNRSLVQLIANKLILTPTFLLLYGGHARREIKAGCCVATQCHAWVR